MVEFHESWFDEFQSSVNLSFYQLFEVSIDFSSVSISSYLRHMRSATDSEKAGGFHIKMACERALQEALCGIFYTFDISAAPSPAPSSSSSGDPPDVEMT